jgi:BolA protein
MNTPRMQLMEQRLKEQLCPTHLKIIDDSAMHIGHAGSAGGAGHYTVEIQSPQFEGKSLIAKHRMVYAALGDLMDQEIHALIIKVD